MKIIAISGKARHGKDTVARAMKSKLEADENNVLIAHYADLLKYICRTFFEWDGKKDNVGRDLLQYVGTDIVRKRNPDFWVDFIIDILNFFPDEWDYVLIPDSRFPNEIDRLEERGFDVIHIRVIRPNFASPLTAKSQSHPSETALDNAEPDYVIINDEDIAKLNIEISKFVEDALYGGK